MKKSLLALLFAYTCLAAIHFFYYPKWKLHGTESTFGWDVSGYYMYLPAAFIYNDLSGLGFADSIIQKYQTVPQIPAYKHPETGNYIFKYSSGQAVMYSPFFFIGHLWASISSEYPADGFSLPYRFMVGFGTLLIAFLGLFVLRKVLLEYFSDTAVAMTIICIALAYNYLEYSAIGGVLTHNSIFTLYSLMLWQTIQFHRSPNYKNAIFIGLLAGLTALIRPSDILIIIIPLLWGFDPFSAKSYRAQINLYVKNAPKLIVAVVCCIAVGSIQLVYWKAMSGHWLVYSYQEEGFSWLHPHVYNAFFHPRSGWLLYSPVFFFAIFGFIPLFKQQRSIWAAIAIFSFIFTYVVVAWDNWWYGGGVGLRAMIEAYAVLALPMAAFWEWVSKRKIVFISLSLISILFIYYNVWLTHQAHKGGLFFAGNMTNAYLWHILGRYSVDEQVVKLLDTNELFLGERKEVKILWQSDFEQDSTIQNCEIPPIQGEKSLCMTAERQYSPEFQIPFDNAINDFVWLRVNADYRCWGKEWNHWQMTQLIVDFQSVDKTIKTKILRVYRLFQDGETKSIYFDVKIPRKSFDKIIVKYWNANSQKSIVIDNLQVEAFK